MAYSGHNKSAACALAKEWLGHIQGRDILLVGAQTATGLLKDLAQEKHVVYIVDELAELFNKLGDGAGSKETVSIRSLLLSAVDQNTILRGTSTGRF